MKRALIVCVALAAAPAEAKMIQHQVKAGETLQKISMQYFGTTRKWHQLYVLNKKVLSTPNAVEPGMTLEFDDQLAGEGPQTAKAPATAPVAPTPPDATAGPTTEAAAPAPAPVAPPAARAPATPAKAAPVPTAPIADAEATSEPIVVPPKKERAKENYPSKEAAEASDVAEGEDESDLTADSKVTFRFGSHKFIGPDL